MVVTSKILQDRTGIDSKIADFFANERKVPSDNLFWFNKRIYISAGFGFLTIPFTFDLIYKMGVSTSALLADEHVTLMEQGFHQLKLYEANKITFPEFMIACAAILEGKIKQKKLAADLFAVFGGERPSYFVFEEKHKALARSDSFLFTLVDLDLSDEWISTFMPVWYAMARPILLIDDFKDLMEDRLQKDENTIIELGNNASAIMEAYEMGLRDLAILAKVNPKLSSFLKTFLDDALNYMHIREELANQ
jgi:hypothetical protein